ncbi:hypothetical protein JW979_06820, partial [bacterium]|nr:hypothetical protein [candidate division CSSED10-310 bacterium]
LSTVERTTTLKEAFTLADEVLSNAVQGISDLITVPGLINLDFADVKAVMSGMGKALMGTGFGSGESKAIDAIKRAISSPLLDELSVEGARGILINITGGNDLTLIETDAATQLLQDSADPEANIIFGAVVSEHYQDRVKVTVIATGFESAKVKSEPFPLYVSNRKNISGKPETASDSITDEISESDNSLTNTVSSEAIIHDDHEEAEDTLVEEPNKSDDEVEDYETSESPSSDAENNPVLVNTLHQPELELDSEDEIDEDLEITDKIVKPEESPVLADNHAASDDTSELVQPELELSNPNNSVLFDAKLPAYKRRDLGKGQFKRQPEIDKYTIRVETSNYMIPAFMRRKAD